MGILIGDDMLLKREQFKEAAHLIGIPAKYQYFLDKHYTSHTEVKGTFSEPEDLDIIFEEHPPQKTLKTLGWYSEDKENRPMIAHLPFDTKNLEFGCRLLLPHGITGQYKVFKITEISTIMIYPDRYFVKLAPEYMSDVQEQQHDYTRTNSNFLEDDDE